MHQKIRYAFYAGWMAKGRKLFSILRYTETGGSNAAGIAPTRTLVSGLSNLKCIATRVSERDIFLLGSSIVDLADFKFIFYMPASLFPIADTDVVSFDSDSWEIVKKISSISETGFTEIIARRTKQ